MNVESAVHQALQEYGVQVVAYDQLGEHLAGLSVEATLLFDTNAVTAGVLMSAQHLSWQRQANPSTLLKASKNAHEQEQIRQVMVQDGIALCEFYAWFRSEERRVGKECSGLGGA